MESAQPTMQIVNGEIVELQPVRIDRSQLADDLAKAEAEANSINATVNQLEAHEADLQNQVSVLQAKIIDMQATMAVAYKDQEAANEVVAFRQGKLDTFDELVAAAPSNVDAEPSDVSEIEPEQPVAGQPSAEDVAQSLGLETDTSEPEAPSTEEEQIIPIRRLSRSRV